MHTTRERLRRAVREQERRRVLDNVTAWRLRRVCLNVAVDLFYPVVYRVDIVAIADERLRKPTSVAAASREVLVPDLREAEFDLLFVDNHADDLFQRLVLSELGTGARRTAAHDVLTLLETRRVP